MNLRRFVAVSLSALSLSITACDPSEDDDEQNDDVYDGVTETPADQIDADDEVKAAYHYLNSVRQNPAAYADEVGTDDMKSVEPRGVLKWNERLAKAAQYKAEDMIARGYFGHVDPDGFGMNYWVVKFGYPLPESLQMYDAQNTYESIAAGYASGKSTIIQLLYDGGEDNKNAGHRRHLLGIPSYYSNLIDIGIGHAYDPAAYYRHYWCILAAK